MSASSTILTLSQQQYIKKQLPLVSTTKWAVSPLENQFNSHLLEFFLIKVDSLLQNGYPRGVLDYNINDVLKRK